MTLIDKDQIKSISGGEPDILLPILEDFIISAETLISEALELTKTGQLAATTDLFHQLKGSSGTLGLSSFFEACKVAETASRAGTTPDLASLKSLLAASTEEATAFMSSE